MIDSIKKAILAGVGAAALTKEKAEEALSDLVEKGKISANDAKEAARKIADDGKEEFESASAKVQEKFDELLDKMGRKHSARIEELETKVAALEARLADIEDSKSKTAKSKQAFDFSALNFGMLKIRADFLPELPIILNTYSADQNL